MLHGIPDAAHPLREEWRRPHCMGVAWRRAARHRVRRRIRESSRRAVGGARVTATICEQLASIGRLIRFTRASCGARRRRAHRHRRQRRGEDCGGGRRRRRSRGVEYGPRPRRGSGLTLVDRGVHALKGAERTVAPVRRRAVRRRGPRVRALKRYAYCFSESLTPPAASVRRAPCCVPCRRMTTPF